MRPTRAEISLDSLKHNLSVIRKRIGEKVKIMGVVKANAYGHGIIEISKFISKKQRLVDYLGVAIFEEGRSLRENGIGAPIHVFIPPSQNQIEGFLKYNLEPTISSYELAENFNTLGIAHSIKIPIHIKIDTGMGRIGIAHEQSVELIKKITHLNNLQINGIYSHYATSDEKDKSFANLQLGRFKQIKSALNDYGLIAPIFHIANSAAIFDIPESYFDMVRPGLSMYGYHPNYATSISTELQPILSIKSKISFIKIVESGSSISYGRRYYTKEKTKIVSIPIGYADGIYRSLSNKGNVIINEKQFNISGTICMDQIMVDVGLDNNIKEGDDAMFIGESNGQRITAWDVANKANTIPYEICCSISDRVPRIYFE